MPKRILSGKVITAIPKTVIVEVTRTFRHPKYHKVVKSRKKFAAHDEESRCKVGDEVSIIESKPISKTKTWIVIENQREDIK